MHFRKKVEPTVFGRRGLRARRASVMFTNVNKPIDRHGAWQGVASFRERDADCEIARPMCPRQEDAKP